MKRNYFFMTVLAILLTVPLAIHSADMNKARLGRGNHAMGLMKMFKVADELELTNPQLLQLRLIYQKSCNRKQENVSPKELGKKLSAPDITEAEIKKIAAEHAKAVEESIIYRFTMMQEIKKVLSPEQLKKLEEMKSYRHGKRGRRHGKSGMKKGRRHSSNFGD